ncbi:EF-hand protein, partial [Nadsonia fulvescens var. elongata DSM 6958]
RKKSFNVDKPWKHHVDAVILNEAERKRYEGLWAANKGVHLDFMGHEDGLTEDEEYEEDMYDHEEDDSEDTYITNDCIHGYIVREIWARSRLSDDTLAQIWELVDRVKGGTLDREGFLVGMWLVDQCLYGRKLPTKVDENVWRSVGRMNVHVKIKIYKQKKKQKK